MPCLHLLHFKWWEARIKRRVSELSVCPARKNMVTPSRSRGLCRGKEPVEMPSTLSTVLLEEPPKQPEDVDGTAATLVTDQHAAVYRCNVRDCDQPAIIHDPTNTEEEER